MNTNLTLNTQAVLLLTAPLMDGKAEYSSELLSLDEYIRLASALRQIACQSADLLGLRSEKIIAKVHGPIDAERIKRLLSRRSLLSQAAERWQAREIWAVSREEYEYPKRVKGRLEYLAPAVLYGCGDSSIFLMGGLAVIGSGYADSGLTEYSENVGRLAAKSGKILISDGASWVSLAAMHSALKAGGRAIVVLADSLEQMAVDRDTREYTRNKQLVLISAEDPAGGGSVDHAIKTNKIIYSLADAALIVSFDYKTGVTWAGATEQLEKLGSVPVYVRTHGDKEQGLEELVKKGARLWLDPSTPEELLKILDARVFE
jgi:DNA processing protein